MADPLDRIGEIVDAASQDEASKVARLVEMEQRRAAQAERVEAMLHGLIRATLEEARERLAEKGMPSEVQSGHDSETLTVGRTPAEASGLSFSAKLTGVDMVKSVRGATIGPKHLPTEAITRDAVAEEIVTFVEEVINGPWR